MSHDKKNPAGTDEVSPLEALQELSKAAIEQIDRHIVALKAGLAKMQSREAEGSAALAKKSGSEPIQLTVNTTVFDVLGKSEDVIDLKNSNNPDKRIKTIGGKGAVLPGDKAAKEIKAKGSGGDIKKNAMPSGPTPGASKPSGVPSAPKPPKAPGAAPTMHKMDIPSTTEKANGGPQPTKKMEIPASHEKANGGPQPTKKMDMPDSVEQANGGQSMAKMALSPVFGVKPRIGGKDPTSQQMTHDASKAAHTAATANTVQALPQNKMPSMAQHAQRAQYMNSLTPSSGVGHQPTGAANRRAPIDLPADPGAGQVVHGAAMTPHSNMGHSMAGAAPARHAAIDLPADDGDGQIVQGADALHAFTPPSTRFGKKEMDSMKCPKCKKGMSACSCTYKK